MKDERSVARLYQSSCEQLTYPYSILTDKTTTANKLPKNIMESGNFCGFFELKEDEEFSIEDNLPEWSDSEEHFPNGQSTQGLRALKSSYTAEDMPNDDPVYWEKEVNDLMESLKQFQANLEGRSPIIDEVFKFQPSEKYKDGDELKASLAEIEKLDALLKIKDSEEKKAKLNRLQVEEESRAILANLKNITMTTGIKMNSEEFLRLLYDTDKLETGFYEEDTAGEENKPDDAKEEKKCDNAEDKNLKATGAQQKLKFVERNIQLAKCGRGVLSLTDEEKLRIESLLIDIADPKPNNTEQQKIDQPDFYALDDESKSILSEIDQKLEAFSKEKSEGSLSLLENLKVEEDKIKETGIKNVKKKKDSPNRLLAINKMLNGINLITEKEISPLSQGDINRMIEEASESMTEAEVKPSPDMIAELVSKAKVLMPKFKYRFKEG